MSNSRRKLVGDGLGLLAAAVIGHLGLGFISRRETTGLAPTSGFVCEINCLFPKELTEAEFARARREWENEIALRELNSEFLGTSALRQQSFAFSPQQTKWVLEFKDKDSFIAWERRLTGVFNRTQFKKAGFKYVVSAREIET